MNGEYVRSNTSWLRLYKSRMLALAALPALVSDCSLDRLVCLSSTPCCCELNSPCSAASTTDDTGDRDTDTESTVTASTKCEVIFTLSTAGCLNAYGNDSGWKFDAENTG